MRIYLEQKKKVLLSLSLPLDPKALQNRKMMWWFGRFYSLGNGDDDDGVDVELRRVFRVKTVMPSILSGSILISAGLEQARISTTCIAIARKEDTACLLLFPNTSTWGSHLPIGKVT